MPEPVFSFTLHTTVLVLAAIAAFSISYALYTRTVPPVSRRLRYILVILRGSGLLLLALLLGEPVLSLLSRSEEPPTTLVLIDNSRSMTITDRSGNRRQQLLEILTSTSFDRLAEIGAVRAVVFDAEAKPLAAFHTDSLMLNGDQTDLATTLRYARTTASSGNIRSVVLISDGNATIGGSPLLEVDNLDLPIFTVGIGDSAEQRDLLVRKVLTNTVAYTGTRVPVNVHILSSGYSGERVEVFLKNAAGVIDRQVITLEEGTREYSVRLSFTAETEGRQRFTAEVSELPGEVTGRNNQSTFFVRILKSKVNVLLVAGGPSPDVAFIRRHLERDKNIELTAFIEKDAGRMYEGNLTAELLAKQECLLLIGVPGGNTSSEMLQMILSAAENGKALFFLPSRTLDIAKLRSLEPVLPVSVQRPTNDEIQVFFHVPEFRRAHAVLKGPEASFPDNWSTLPPLFSLRTLFRSKPESEILAFSRIQTVITDEPLLVLRNTGGLKSAALLGYGLWRWRMFSGEDRHFEQLLNNMIRWLTVTEDTRRIRVQPVDDLFTTQDPVEFTGHVYDESLQPVEDARISIVITGNSERNELSLTPLGNGQYDGRANTLEAGNYEYEATVDRGGKTLSIQRGTFSVGGINAEFLETRTNTLLLRQLAARTGGAYVRPEELPEVIGSLPDFQPRVVSRAEHFELWNLQWSLSLLVAIFSLEWFIRKRNGML